MNKIQFLSLCIILECFPVRSENYTSVIQTASGPVRGVITTTIENFDYAAFKGIPYGKPPVGYLRFRPPVEVDSWTEVYNATSYGSMCTQYNSTSATAVGSEDCLYLNVFTPHTQFNSSILKPVIVWIYGGAFTTGNSNGTYYGPDFLVAQDVLVVSMNYRISALGFLNLRHRNATGNCGLKDQNLALKWVKKNIAQFGGDSDKITVMGQSAGSISTDLQVLSDMSTGLFKQSISMSGSTLCLYWGFQSGAEAVEQAFILGSKLGTVTFSKDTLLRTLYNASAADIVIAENKIIGIPFRPSIEKSHIATDEEKFLTECSLAKYISGNYTMGPHMMGFTADETVSFTRSMDDLSKFTEAGLRSIENSTSNIPFISDLVSAINTEVSNLTEAAIYNLIKKTTDLFFVLGIDTKQRLIARKSSHPVYYYRFSFDSNYSAHRASGIDLDGVGHEDDLPYIFYMPQAEIPLNKSDIATTRQRMVKMWTNFAKYSNPTPYDKNDKVLGITWPDSRSRGKHLEIGKKLSIDSRPIDTSVKVLQMTELGASPVFNDCTKSVFADVVNSFVSIIGSLG